MKNNGGVLSQIKKFCPTIVETYQKLKKPDFETLQQLPPPPLPHLN
jgi:hypothetical protein